MGKSFRTNIRWLIGFMRYALAHVDKSRLVLVRIKRYVAQLALALVCYFYLLRTLNFITWSNEVQAFKACKLWHFLF